MGKVRVAMVASHMWCRSSHWFYDNPQRFEDQDILNHRLGLLVEVVGWCCMPFSTIFIVNPGYPGLESSFLVSS